MERMFEQDLDCFEKPNNRLTLNIVFLCLRGKYGMRFRELNIYWIASRSFSIMTEKSLYTLIKKNDTYINRT